jgi:UDP-glucose 4-epimerase
MKALVTGGAGFIGSHLCQRLLARGFEVTCLDNLVCGRLKNLDEFKSSPNFTFVQADIRDKKALNSAMEGVNWVFHLAGLADIVPSIENPSLYFDMNVNGTLHVLECARET